MIVRYINVNLINVRGITKSRDPILLNTSHCGS
jgi:hypothetical protein